MQGQSIIEGLLGQPNVSEWFLEVHDNRHETKKMPGRIHFMWLTRNPESDLFNLLIVNK